MKTNELTGALLDYWTARAEGVLAADLEFRGAGTLCVRMLRNGPASIDGVMVLDYSTNWAQGGPLLEKHQMELEFDVRGFWRARTVKQLAHMDGDAPLIAICRAVVRAAFGDEVGEIS